MSASIRQLEMERDELRHQLAEVAGRSQTDINLLQEHMEMQVHQQVQQRQRDLLEQVHEQLREQQQQILALQELVQKQKRQIENQDAEVDEIDLENSTLPYEQLKPAFSKLQVSKNCFDKKKMQNVFIYKGVGGGRGGGGEKF